MDSAAINRNHVTRVAVKQSMTEGIFIDTKLYAFSRRKTSGIVDRPKALYANSAILKTSSAYFAGRKISTLSTKLDGA